ncbi:unnamed protein product, partial [Ascophyllum nodosum]
RRGEGKPNPPRETKNSGANGGRNWRTRPRGRTDRKRVDWGLEVDGKCEGSGTRRTPS